MGFRERFATAIEEFLKERPEFPEIFGIVKGYSRKGGKIWGVGTSYFGKGLAGKLQDKNLPLADENGVLDLDFVLEKTPLGEIKPPEGWGMYLTRWVSVRLVREGYRVDISYLTPYVPTINDFLNQAPLTVQALAYDFQSKKVISGYAKGSGHMGFNSYKNRIVKVNNPNALKKITADRKVTEAEFLAQKAKALGFS